MDALSRAKITRPAVQGALKRIRLFKVLDSYRTAPATWIAAPAGSGKTTLVSSYVEAGKLPCLWYQLDEGDSDPSAFFYYLGLAVKKAAPRYRRPMPLLTPEFRFGTSEFAKNYFAELFRRIGAGLAQARGGGGRRQHIIVLDNYQLLDPASPVHEFIRSSAHAMPKEWRLICMSRSEPPAVWNALRLDGTLKELPGEEIALSLQETKSLLRGLKGASPKDDAIETIRNRARGWVAGTLLLAAQQQRPGKDQASPPETDTEGLFTFFAKEVLGRLDPEIQDFLLMSSFLPVMTADGAAELTGDDDAGRILERLARDRFFTERRRLSPPTYQYHPLFREFLATQMKRSLSVEGVRRIEQRAAAILELSGQFEDAADLYAASAEWASLTRILISHAQELISQGRSAALERRIATVPGDILERTPWLLFWLGVCRLPMDPAGSRARFESAYARFKAGQDPAGVLLGWSGIVDSYIYEWNDLSPLHNWIGEIEKQLRKLRGFPSREIEERVSLNLFVSLFLIQPWHADLPQWKRKVETLLQKSDSINFQLMSGHHLILYNVLIGNIAGADRLHSSMIRKHQLAGPAERTLAKTLEAYYLWAKGYGEASLEAVRSGLQTAQETGVYMWGYTLASIGAYTSLATQDSPAVEKYFQSMERFADRRRGIDTSHYHYLRGWQALMNGEVSRALEHSHVFMRLNGAGGPVFFAGFNHVSTAMILFALGRTGEARNELEEAKNIAQRGRSALLEYHTLLVEAEWSGERGEEAESLRTLSAAFAVGSRRQIFNFDWWIPEVMARLCMKALEHGIEVEYTRECIRRHAILSENPPYHIEHWPWSFRVRTFGSLMIERDGKRLRLPGKVPKKPLELLKLMASAGKDLGDTAAGDALWPDADGDAARGSLKVTIHRLRQLLGSEQAVRHRDGKAGLDERMCWSDVSVFERLIADADEAVRESREERRKLELAISLYRGNFLENDPDRDRDWALSPRERLRSKFLRSVKRLGAIYDAQGELEKAADLFLRALEVDDLTEDFYLNLMRAYQRLGKKAEALRVYERCRKTFAASLGLEPAEEMTRIADAVLSKAE